MIISANRLMYDKKSSTHVATSEVTTLEHEFWDHTVELGVLVAEALLSGAEGTEVLGGLGHDIIVESEVDATILF